MAHEHSVFDQDPHFVVDEQTRQIKYQGDTPPQIVQHDHNSERLTFQLPKVIDGHDMTKCDKVRVNYINIDSLTKETSKGVYEVDDVAADETDDTKIHLSWLISGNATKFAGKLNFMICFMCEDADGNITYRWNTLVNGDLVVGNGMDNGEAIAEEYADILEQWRQEFRIRDGVDGVSPVLKVADIDGGHEVSITDKDGEQTFSIMDGVSPSLEQWAFTMKDETTVTKVVAVATDDGAQGDEWTFHMADGSTVTKKVVAV